MFKFVSFNKAQPLGHSSAQSWRNTQLKKKKEVIFTPTFQINCLYV